MGDYNIFIYIKSAYSADKKWIWENEILVFIRCLMYIVQLRYWVIIKIFIDHEEFKFITCN